MPLLSAPSPAAGDAQSVTRALADVQDIDDQRVFLSTVSPSRRDWLLATTMALLSLLAFVAVAPFAKVQLPVVPAFIPAYESALLINDLITAILLFGQFGILRSRGLLVLAGGYLFSALMAVPHALTFPGVFAPQGLLGAGPQTTAWLYISWHILFPLIVIVYALPQQGRGVIAATLSVRTAVIGTALTVACTVAGLTLAAVLAEPLLPPILSGLHYTPTAVFSLGVIGAVSLLSLVVLWLRRPHTLLDVWLMVVMCAWLFDVGLSAMLNNGRYDLGFYAGRIYVVLGASFVLALMLGETTLLYTRLAGAAKRVSDYAALLEEGVRTRTIELQRSNEALGESERRFRDIAEVSGDWMWEADRAHRFTLLFSERTNGPPIGAESLVGMMRREGAGAGPDELWARHKADLDTHQTFRHFRYEVRTPAGAPMFISASGKPVFDRDGNFLGYRGTATDETTTVEARRQAEAAEALVRRVFETSLDLILVTDRKGTLIRISPSAMSVLGYDPDELVGRNGVDLVYSEDLEATRNEMRKSRRGGATQNFECRYVHKQGRIVTLWWTGVWSPCEQQHFFIGRDITDRKQAERRLRESEEQLKRAQHLANMGSIHVNIQTEETDWSDETYRIFGISRETFVPSINNYLPMIHPDDRATVRTIQEQVRQGINPQSLEYRCE